MSVMPPVKTQRDRARTSGHLGDRVVNRGMAGWIDLHCHILPSVDDGAVDLEMSLEMARQLKEAGFDVIAPSPHYGFGPGVTLRPPRRTMPVRCCVTGLMMRRLA